ncbi:MAG: hypothetical protein IK093_11615, partial [Ruminiclostridium sp.]|nr:hypothetical protein [Ruminiclostridium sp.]
MRFPFYRPAKVMDRVSELQLPRTEYTAAPGFSFSPTRFITEDDKDFALLHSHPYRGGKFDVEDFFSQNYDKTTYQRMKQLSKRIYPALGHIRVDKLTSRQIQQFISDLALNGKNLQT